MRILFAIFSLVLLQSCAELLDTADLKDAPRYCSEVTGKCDTSKERIEAEDKRVLEKYCSVYPKDKYYRAPVSIAPSYRYSGKYETTQERWNNICKDVPGVKIL